jgi:CBS domain-containing protein
MKTLSKTPVAGLRASDLMRRDLVTLAVDETIRAALEMLEESRVTAAPVIEESGRLVGVFSRSDVARADHLRGGRLEERPGSRDYVDLDTEDDFDLEVALAAKEDYSPEVRGDERVGDWMTRGGIAVAPDTPLLELCRALVEHRIHRVFVCEGGRPVGVVSTLDVVAALASALETS